jgi:hypothetical protein
MQLQAIQDRIYELRGRKVILEEDLAWLYGIDLKILQRVLQRHAERLPDTDMFLLTPEECLLLALPVQPRCAFTQHGVTALVSLLKSEGVINMDTEFAMRYFRVLYHMRPDSRLLPM